MLAARRNACGSCDNSRGNMFHKYVCCIVYNPPALTLHCQCSPRRAPQEFSISLSLSVTLSNKCSCIRKRHEDKVPLFFKKGAGWPSRGALRIALCAVTLVFSFSRIGVSHRHVSVSVSVFCILKSSELSSIAVGHAGRQRAD